MPDASLLGARALRTSQGFLAILACALLVLLSACATTQAPADSQLAGHWQLQPQASDHVRAKVTQAVDRAEANLRRRYRLATGARAAPAGGGGGDADQDENFEAAGDLLGNGLMIGPDFKQLRVRLTQTLDSPATLVLQVQPDDVTIQRDGLPARDYQAGQTITLFNEYGAARLESRWSGKAFEIRERYTSGARLTERYEVDAAGQLVFTRNLQDPTAGKLDIRSVYTRH